MPNGCPMIYFYETEARKLNEILGMKITLFTILKFRYILYLLLLVYVLEDEGHMGQGLPSFGSS